MSRSIFFYAINEKTLIKMQEQFIQEMFLEKRSCKEIQNKLEIEFGKHAYKQSTIYKHLKRLRLGLP